MLPAREKMAELRNSAQCLQTSDTFQSVSLQTHGHVTGEKQRRIILLVLLAFGNHLVAASVSLQAPFFPLEAESKGVYATRYGFVFSIFELSVMIFAPICGKFAASIGSKFLLTSGLFLIGGASIIFGFLDKVVDGDWFFALALAARIVEGIGTAMFVTAVFIIVAAEFTDTIASIYALQQTAFGSGLIIGPSLGGLLYYLGGYPLPFITVGCLLFICDLFIYKCLPIHDETSRSTGTGNMFKFWMDFEVFVDAYSIFSTFLIIGYNGAVLEPHIRQFGLPSWSVGFIFVINGLTYAATSWIWGWVCDKMKCTKILILIGCLLLGINQMFIGPAPFFPFETKLWMIIVAQILFGLGSGGTIVCPFVESLKNAQLRGFSDDIRTYGLVSSLYTISHAVGAFVGPTIGGYLFTHVGFRNGTLFLFFNLIVLALLIVISHFYYHRSICALNTKLLKRHQYHKQTIV